MPIFRICVFSPFLKQQKLEGDGGEECLQPAGPCRQSRRAGSPFISPWEVRGAGKRAGGEGGRPQRVPHGAARSVILRSHQDPAWLELGHGVRRAWSVAFQSERVSGRDSPGLILLEMGGPRCARALGLGQQRAAETAESDMSLCTASSHRGSAFAISAS